MLQDGWGQGVCGKMLTCSMDDESDTVLPYTVVCVWSTKTASTGTMRSFCAYVAWRLLTLHACVCG